MTTYFWRFGDHEVAAVPRFMRGFDILHDGQRIAKARAPLYAVEFEVEEDGRQVTYRVHVVKGWASFYRQLAGAEMDREGVHVVGSR